MENTGTSVWTEDEVGLQRVSSTNRTLQPPVAHCCLAACTSHQTIDFSHRQSPQRLHAAGGFPKTIILRPGFKNLGSQKERAPLLSTLTAKQKQKIYSFAQKQRCANRALKVQRSLKTYTSLVALEGRVLIQTGCQSHPPQLQLTRRVNTWNIQTNQWQMCI